MTLLILILSFASALLLGAISLRFIVKLITREQYNVSDAPRRVRAIVWVDSDSGSDAGPDSVGGGPGRAAGKPYLLPAAARNNRFARISEPVSAVAGRIVQFPRRAPRRTAEGGSR